MNLEELESELVIIEDSIANLQLEIDVSHKPSERILSEKKNLEAMREGVKDAIERVLRTKSDPTIDYEKTQAYDAFIAYYAKTVRISEKNCRTLLSKYVPFFERAYDEGVRDPQSLFLVVRKHM